MLKDLRSKARWIRPIVRIGKNGITDSLIEEIKKALKTKKLVKVRLLDAASLDRKSAGKEIAEKTSSLLVHVVGNVVTLYKN